MHVLTVASDQLININYAFLNSTKRKKLECQGLRVGAYYVSMLLSQFFQINNNIPYLLAAQKQIIFRLKFLCASHLKIRHFELPPSAYKIEHMKTKLTEIHT